MRDDRIEVPRHLKYLGESLEPIWESLQDALYEVPDSEDRPALRPEQASRHLQRAADFTNKVVSLLGKRLVPLLPAEDTPRSRMAEVARQLDTLIQCQLHHLHEAEAGSFGTDGYGHALVARIYRHNLEELRDWLEEVINLTIHTETVLKPGQSPHVQSHLEFTPAPEIEALEALMTSHCHNQVKSVFKGFWGTVGAIALGIGIADFFFGGSDAD